MPNRRRAVVAAAALLLALEIAPGSAAAQPGNSPLNTPAGAAAAAPAAAPAPGEGASGSYKSPGTALALSLGGTLGTMALIGIGGATENGPASSLGSIGLWVAPSFGHWYVGKGWTTGLKWRLAGAGAAAIGMMWFAVDCIPGCGDSEVHPALFLAIGGGVSFVGGTVHDIATAPGAARAHNARLDEARFQNVTVRPSIGNDRFGVAVSGRF